MRLKDLIRPLEIEAVKGDMDVEITGLSSDSNKVSAGHLFICLKGAKFNGHDFLVEAQRRGANACLVERDVDLVGPTIIMVKDTRSAEGVLAARFFNHPTSRLKMIGVTGTNGKTTTTYLIEAILKAAGFKVGRISTTDYSIDGEKGPVPVFTTPQAIELQEILAGMLSRGITHAVLEVSSQGLSTSRVVGCDFDIAIFTNLSLDHLDFHGTMEDYLEAKARLFESLREDTMAIINIDDLYSKRIISKTRAGVLTYGLGDTAQLRAEGLRLGLNGSCFSVGDHLFELGLIGRHNLYNALASIGVGVTLNIEMSIINEALKEIDPIPGRLEFIKMGQDFNLIIDYAHSPAALKEVLETLRGLTKGRVITLFGCGGDRDRSKRPIMGRIASLLSDYLIITSDNPRSEDPLKIIKEIEDGLKMTATKAYTIIPDRNEAIYKAIDYARKEDTVIIAGKGHESFQIIGDKKIPFDDRKIARLHLQERLRRQ